MLMCICLYACTCACARALLFFLNLFSQADLTSKRVVEEDAIEEFCQRRAVVYAETSARTGAGFEQLERLISSMLLKQSE